MKIYIAGSICARNYLKVVRDELQRDGHVVTSSWLDGDDIASPDATLWRAVAKRDRLDIICAEMLVLDTMSAPQRGGREVEYGFALARGKEVIVVGPQRNVFHFLAAVVFASWEDARLYLKERL